MPYPKTRWSGQRLNSRREQNQQVPHGIMNDASTRSPAFTERTAAPASSTTPANSWPRMPPGVIPGMRPWSTCRSLPQIAVVVTRSSTSVGSSMVGRGTSAISTRPMSTNVSARICGSLLPASPASALSFPGAALRDAVAHGLVDLAPLPGLTAQPERQALGVVLRGAAADLDEAAQGRFHGGLQWRLAAVE